MKIYKTLKMMKNPLLMNFNHRKNLSKDINAYAYPKKPLKQSINERRRSKNYLYSIDLKKKNSRQKSNLSKSNSKHDIFIKKKMSSNSLQRKKSFKNSLLNKKKDSLSNFEKKFYENFLIKNNSVKNSNNSLLKKEKNNANHNFSIKKNSIKNSFTNSILKKEKNNLNLNYNFSIRKNSVQNSFSNSILKKEKKEKNNLNENLKVIKNENLACDSSMISNYMILNINESKETDISFLEENEKNLKDDISSISISSSLKNVNISRPFKKIENPDVLEKMRNDYNSGKNEILKNSGKIQNLNILDNFEKQNFFKPSVKNKDDVFREKIKNTILLKKQKIDLLRNQNLETKEKLSNLIKIKYLKNKNKEISEKFQMLKNLLQKNPDLKKLIETKLLYINMKKQRK